MYETSYYNCDWLYTLHTTNMLSASKKKKKTLVQRKFKLLTNSLLRSLGTIVTQENSSNIPLNVNSWIESVFALQVWQLAISDIKLYSCVPIQVGLPLKLTQFPAN